MIAKECTDRPNHSNCQTKRDGAAYALSLLQSVLEIDVVHPCQEKQVEC